MKRESSATTPVDNVAIAVRDLASYSGAARNAQEQVRMFRSLGLGVDVYAERVNFRVVELHDAVVHRLIRWPLPSSWRRPMFDVRVRWHVHQRPEAFLISHGDVVTQDVLFMHNCVHLANEILEGCPLPESHPVSRMHTRAITEPGLRLLVANSRMMAHDLGHRFGLKGEQIAVLYQSYSAETFSPDRRSELRALGRARLGLSNDVPLAGLVTSGDFRKRNVDGLLRSARLAAPDIHWLVVGKDRRQECYEQLARDLGIAERVHFQPVIREVAEYYHAIDLFVLPAHIEEFGRSAIEAMACATPVLLGPKVGCAELLAGEALQGLLEDLNPATIARRVDAMLEDPTVLESTAQACAAIAPEYCEKRQAERLLVLLQTHFPERFPAAVG